MKHSGRLHSIAAILCLVSALLLMGPAEQLTSNVSLSLVRSKRLDTVRELNSAVSIGKSDKGSTYEYDGVVRQYRNYYAACLPEDISCQETKQKDSIWLYVLVGILVLCCCCGIPIWLGACKRDACCIKCRELCCCKPCGKWMADRREGIKRTWDERNTEKVVDKPKRTEKPAETIKPVIDQKS